LLSLGVHCLSQSKRFVLCENGGFRFRYRDDGVSHNPYWYRVIGAIGVWTTTVCAVRQFAFLSCLPPSRSHNDPPTHPPCLDFNARDRVSHCCLRSTLVGPAFRQNQQAPEYFLKDRVLWLASRQLASASHSSQRFRAIPRHDFVSNKSQVGYLPGFYFGVPDLSQSAGSTRHRKLTASAWPLRALRINPNYFCAICAPSQSIPRLRCTGNYK